MPDFSDPKHFPRTNLPPFSQALVIRALRNARTPPVSGAGLMTVRRAVLAGSYDDHPAAKVSRDERRRLRKMKVEDMPPASDDVALLIETLSQRMGAVGHKAAWQAIGIKPDRGRELLSRSSRYVDWPIWSTLLRAALD